QKEAEIATLDTKSQIGFLGSDYRNQKAAEANALREQIANLRNTASSITGNGQFNSLEAATLGLSSGEGLYNLGANAIKSGVAEKDRLISKDEQARQAALAQLAGLDLSNQLSTNLLYDNAERAGTQTALDALDLEGTRKAINEAEQNFQQ